MCYCTFKKKNPTFKIRKTETFSFFFFFCHSVYRIFLNILFRERLSLTATVCCQSVIYRPYSWQPQVSNIKRRKRTLQDRKSRTLNRGDNAVQIRRHSHPGVCRRGGACCGFTCGNGSVGPEQSCIYETVTKANVHARTGSVVLRRAAGRTVQRAAVVQVRQKDRRKLHMGRYIQTANYHDLSNTLIDSERGKQLRHFCCVLVMCNFRHLMAAT